MTAPGLWCPDGCRCGQPCCDASADRHLANEGVPASTALGVQLADARRRLGWSLRAAERASGVPNAHISQIETGTITEPRFAVVAKLAVAYGLKDLARCPTCGRPGNGEDRQDRVAESTRNTTEETGR